jgi:hypothetical protein
MSRILNYLKDWKNIATHSAVGITLLYFLIVAPLEVWQRLAALGGVITFNIGRMHYNKFIR